MPLAALWALTACAGSTGADLPAAPVALSAPCVLPQSLPPRDLTQAEVERLWGRDRGALRDCSARHGLLVTFVAGQRAARP